MNINDLTALGARLIRLPGQLITGLRVRRNRLKWIEALRSGKYLQTEGYLHDSKGFCCLGVACDVRNPDGWVHDSEYVAFRHVDNDPTLVVSLSPHMMALYGIDDAESEKLINMNDGGEDFVQIAVEIERNTTWIIK